MIARKDRNTAVRGSGRLRVVERVGPCSWDSRKHCPSVEGVTGPKWPTPERDESSNREQSRAVNPPGAQTAPVKAELKLANSV